MSAKQKVVIAGAGPVGLVTALGLARQDVEVTLLEGAITESGVRR